MHNSKFPSLYNILLQPYLSPIINACMAICCPYGACRSISNLGKELNIPSPSVISLDKSGLTLLSIIRQLYQSIFTKEMDTESEMNDLHMCLLCATSFTIATSKVDWNFKQLNLKAYFRNSRYYF